MHRSLPALFRDLETRAALALSTLHAVESGDLAERVERATGDVNAILAEVQREIALPADRFRLETEEATIAYTGLSRELHLLESFDVPFLARFADCDRRLTGVCAALLNDVKWPMPPPLVASFSREYYWAKPDRELIGTPSGEDQRLLGLPDVCHELGHILFRDHEVALVGRFVPVIFDYVGSRRGSAAAGITDPAGFYARLPLSWLRWLQEFGCDLIGAYIAGAAYGWQHLRMCASLRIESVYEVPTGLTHPGDDARMRVIAMMIRRLGLEPDAQELEDHWQGFAATRGSAPSAEYAEAFPDDLLRDLANTVHDALVGLGVRAYDDDLSHSVDVPALLNEAWRQIRAEPESYAQWEQDALQGLWTRLDLPAA